MHCNTEMPQCSKYKKFIFKTNLDILEKVCNICQNQKFIKMGQNIDFYTLKIGKFKYTILIDNIKKS